jgi:ADP-dependent NAD(P)H-hydrate dehydratase
VERAEVLTPQLLREWPLPSPGEGGGKHERGTVHVIGGAVSTPGAVLLAGLSALRVGAGRLQITTVEATAVALAVQVPEAMVRGATADDAGSLTEVEAGSADAVVLGPGVLGDGIQKLVRSVVSGLQGALVLDALALVDLEPQHLGSRAVLTPNLDELEALAGRAGDDLDRAREVSARFSAVVCTQGWVAAPDGRCWRNEAGSVGLGTSGSGDVLAGVVGGLLARGAAPDQAACWGAYLHAAAGDLLAGRRTPLGYLARELSEAVPEVLSGLM